ncbi:MAG: CBS domain-containing protein [Opitutaceae bacterium]|nr:CBS domain-containing protein [Opitutaceae bacterium]
MNTPISTVLAYKGAAVHQVPTSLTIAEAVHEMNRQAIGSVLVMADDRIAGIFTERDVLRRVVVSDIDPKTTPVSKVMTPQVMTINPRVTVQEVMNAFAEKRIRHLPVVQNGQLLGIISIGDVSRWAANAQRVETEQLRQYVSGGQDA